MIYECEMWALTKVYENKFQVFENKGRRIFGGTQMRIQGNDGSCSIMNGKHGKICAATMGNDRTAHMILVGRSGARPQGRLKQKWGTAI